MEKLRVEFIENKIARCEADDKSFKEIDCSLLPQQVKSGDIIGFDGNEYIILEDETESKKQSMLSLQARLFGKKNKN